MMCLEVDLTSSPYLAMILVWHTRAEKVVCGSI